jgi:thiol-disulfide isomerase/thioredoxin
MVTTWINLLIILMALLLSAPLHAAWQSVLSGEMLGKRLPPLALAGATGAVDGVVLIDFWAPGCVPCQARAPLLNALQSSYRTRGLTVIALAREPPAELARLVQRAPPGYALHTDRAGLFDRLGVRSLPYAVLVDRNGIVAWRGDPARLSRGTIEATLAAPRLGELMQF